MQHFARTATIYGFGTQTAFVDVKWLCIDSCRGGDTNSGAVSRRKAITPASKANSTWHFCRRCWRQTARDSPFLTCAKKAWNGDACSVLTKSSLHDLMWWVWVCLQNDVAKWLKHGARMDPQHWSLLGIYLYLPGFAHPKMMCSWLLFHLTQDLVLQPSLQCCKLSGTRLELVPGLTCSPTWHAVEVWTDLYSEAKGCSCTGTIGP